MNDEKTLPEKKNRLEQIKEGRHCKRLPADATKAERLREHKIRVEAKKIVRDRIYRQNQGPAYIPANLSVHHPDYGMTFYQHYTEKAKRASEKSS